MNKIFNKPVLMLSDVTELASDLYVVSGQWRCNFGNLVGNDVVIVMHSV